MAVLSLMNDLLSSPELRLLPREGDSYSLDSLRMMLGIIAVALNLSVAVMAAANAALASHLSLRPEQKTPNIEAHLIFCMIVLFGTAVVSGSSLTLLSINIDPFFTLFLSGGLVSILHALELLGPHWVKRVYKTPLCLITHFIEDGFHFFCCPTRRDHMGLSENSKKTYKG